MKGKNDQPAYGNSRSLGMVGGTSSHFLRSEDDGILLVCPTVLTRKSGRAWLLCPKWIHPLLCLFRSTIGLFSRTLQIISSSTHRSNIPGTCACTRCVFAGCNSQPLAPFPECRGELLGPRSGAESSSSTGVGLYQSSRMEWRGLVYQRGVVCVPAFSGIPDRDRQEPILFESGPRDSYFGYGVALG